MSSQPTLSEKLKPFQRRVKMLLVSQGFFMGILVGSTLGIVWAALDWKGIVYAEIAQIAGLVLICGAIGAIAKLWTLPDSVALAQSIDRRAKLKDRIGTSLASNDEGSSFADALEADSLEHLSGLNARKVFPFRFGRLHLTALATCMMAGGVFLLGNSNFLATTESVAAKESMKKESVRIEKLRKELFEDGSEKKSSSPELEALQKDLQKLQKDLEKAKIDPKQAMLKAEELAKQADELAKEMAKDSLDDIKEAETMMEKMETEALKKEGLENANLSDAKLSPQEFNQKMDSMKSKAQDAQKRVDQLQQKLDALKEQLNKPGLDAAAKKALEKQIEATQKELQEAKKAAEQAAKDLANMQLSERARATLDKLNNDPMMQEIRELMQKMMKDSKNSAAGKKPSLSKEEREALRKKLEDFLKTLEDEDARKEFLKKLLESLKKGGKAGQCNGLCLGLGLLPGGPGPGPDNDEMISDLGKVRLDKPVQGKGKGTPVFAPTERDDTQPGMEMTFEIKAPTFTGTRSSVPYKNVLPGYAKKAESALNKSEIPKQHQERVKRYFNSLKK